MESPESQVVVSRIVFPTCQFIVCAYAIVHINIVVNVNKNFFIFSLFVPGCSPPTEGVDHKVVGRVSYLLFLSATRPVASRHPAQGGEFIILCHKK